MKDRFDFKDRSDGLVRFVLLVISAAVLVAVFIIGKVVGVL